MKNKRVFAITATSIIILACGWFVQPSCYAVQTAVPASDIASWTYKGIIKSKEGARVKTKQITKEIKDWKSIDGADMVKFPMHKGEEWEHVCDFKRTDHAYCNYVKDVKYKDLSYIKGAGKGLRKVYIITNVLVSSYEEADYAEGVGIIRYEYVHHGTIDEKYMKLVEIKRK